MTRRAFYTGMNLAAVLIGVAAIIKTRSPILFVADAIVLIVNCGFLFDKLEKWNA